MITRTREPRQLKLIHQTGSPALLIKPVALTLALLIAVLSNLSTPLAVHGQQVVVTTKNGLQHEGELFSIEQYSVGYKAPSAYGSGNLVVVIDDGLRRTFIGQDSIGNANGESQRNEIEFDIAQRKYNGSEGTVGQLVKLGNFNEFGHRDFWIRDAKNNRHRFVQGITKITPRYCIVNVLTGGGKNTKQWRMSVATSLIDPDILRGLLVRRADQNNVNDMFDIVDFFRQTRNYTKAREELLLIKNRFPEEKDRIEALRIELRQLEGRQILSDIDKRLSLGQTQLAAAYAKVADSKSFSRTIQAKFEDLKQVADKQQTKFDDVRQQIQDLIATIKDSPPAQRLVIERFQQELQADLSEASLPRLDGYFLKADDNTIPNIRKLSLAISGWLLGSNNAIENMAIAESLYPVKSLALEYLADDVTAERKKAILAELEKLEAGQPAYIDSLLKQSKPVAGEDLSQYNGRKPIEFTVSVPGTIANPGTQTYRCLAHLPTEYDPLRNYPAIISLPGGSQSLENNLNLWCGSYNERLSQQINSAVRNGQASREGLIAVSIEYRKRGQRSYGYSAREHRIVTEGLREALRRFSIDANRVFLSGHFEGANAAYDIGMSHPEHWAGVIGFSGTFDKYLDHYADNKHVGLPVYVVAAEKDYVSKRGLEKNATKWLKSKFERFINLTVVEYKGQLATHFVEEIPSAIKWMEAQKRRWPEGKGFSFECKVMRRGDSYFWFFEMDDVPERMVYDPALYGLEKFNKILKMSGEIQRENIFRIEPTNTSIGRESTLWLSPEYVDFKKRIEIRGRGSFKGIVIPSNKTLLDDVNRRSDVQHPYWAKLKLRQREWSQQQ